MNLNCLEYFDRLRGVASFEESQRVFSDFLSSIGVRDFGYGEGLRTKNTLMYSVNHLPGRFFEHYASLGNGIHDPVIRHCMETAMPSLWDEALNITRLSENEKQFVFQYYQLGYVYGMTIPFKYNDNHFYLLTLPMASRQDCQSFIRESLSDLCALVCFYQNSVIGSDASQAVSSLTQRQRDCLAYSGEGYSSKQIAYHMKIKEDTVNKHIEEAIRRLGARNRVHAVAILVQSGGLL